MQRAALDSVRKKLGNPFEHTVGEGPGSTLFIYAKLWIPKWAELQRAAARGASAHRDTKEKFQARTARLDYLERRGQLIDVNKFWIERAKPFCDEIRVRAERLGRISKEAQSEMAEGLNVAVKKLLVVNGHSDITNGSRTDRAADGGAGCSGETAEPS